MQRPQQRHHTGSRSPSRYKEQKIFVLASKKSIEPTPIQRCLQELKLWRCSVTSTATSYKCRRSGVCALELLCSAERLISKEYSSRIRALTRGSQRIWIWIAKNCFFLISLQIATVIFLTFLTETPLAPPESETSADTKAMASKLSVHDWLVTFVERPYRDRPLSCLPPSICISSCSLALPSLSPSRLETLSPEPQLSLFHLPLQHRRCTVGHTTVTWLDRQFRQNFSNGVIKAAL